MGEPVIIQYIYRRRTINTKRMASQNTIQVILNEIEQNGYSRKSPFAIGRIEKRMKLYAENNNIPLSSKSIFMSSKSIAHALRDSKNKKGLSIQKEDLINFPNNRKKMDLYFDGKCFIYTDYRSKFIIHPNYKLKLKRGSESVVNFITATKVRNPKEFNLKKYDKI